MERHGHTWTIYEHIRPPPSLLRNQEIRNQGLNATQPYFFLSLRNEGLDLPEQICHEMHLIYEFRRHSTIFRTEISSRIHFWGLEGPKMAKIDQKLRFSIKSWFLPGRPRSEPTARPPPPPGRSLPATRPPPNYRPRAENCPFKKNIETLGRKNYFLFWYTSIYIKIRNGQTLDKR